VKRSIATLAGMVFTGALFAQQHPPRQAPVETLKASLDPALKPYKASSAVSGEIRSVGADTMEDLMKLWITGFAAAHPKAKFSMQAKASGTAAPALVEGVSDIGPVAREILPNESEPFVKKFGYPPFAVRVAGGSYRTPGKTHAIAFFVHSSNPIDRLTFAQLDAIFSTTRKRGHKADITTWGELGLTGDWAVRPIVLYGLKRPNGIANFVQERVLQNGEYKQGIKEYTTVGSLPALDAIVGEVAKDPGGIGYAGFGNKDPGAKPVALAEEDASYSKGTFEDVVSRKYPLSRFIYIAVNRAPGKPLDPKVKEFLRFILSKEGQEAVVREGIFLPLSAQVVEKERGRLE